MLKVKFEPSNKYPTWLLRSKDGKIKYIQDAGRFIPPNILSINNRYPFFFKIVVIIHEFGHYLIWKKYGGVHRLHNLLDRPNVPIARFFGVELE